MIKDVSDYCFGINVQSMLNCKEGDVEHQYFNGVLSLKSTTIADFHYGILNGH